LWEFDLTWLVIRLLMALGLARNVAVPSPTLAAKSNCTEPRLASSQPDIAQAAPGKLDI